MTAYSHLHSIDLFAAGTYCN